MSERATHAHAHAATKSRHTTSRGEEQQRKERVLTQGKASMTRDIAHALVIKDGGLFFLTDPDGEVPMDRRHGLGLYYHDCRFLNGYELRMAGVAPNLLTASAERGFEDVSAFANPEIHLEDGTLIPAEALGISWVRLIDQNTPALCGTLTVQNFSLERVELPVSFTFRAEFEDIFAVRGLLAERKGKLHPPAWTKEGLAFVYDGADGIRRTTTVHLSPDPQETRDTSAHFRLSVEPRQSSAIEMQVRVTESSSTDGARPGQGAPSNTTAIRKAAQRAADAWVETGTVLRSDSLLVNGLVQRSIDDLGMLRSAIDGHHYFAAGVPWFVALFGRDSLISALQTLSFDPRIAKETLRILAARQGDKVDDWRDEQPGKILHELRVGEFAHIGEIPQTPYYGTVDATPLFLILVARHAAWTGTLDLFHELRDNIERAFDWIDNWADPDGSGYVGYQSTSKKGLVNQGWKDSGDAIVNADGSLATPPIKLVEVQGYVYAARRELAGLFRRAGEADRAETLEREAQRLRERFNRDFWLEDEGIYAMALQQENRPVAVVSSNAGQALWSGIADLDKAQQTAERLMRDDMFSGWGVRTLSSRDSRYNPVGYHLGTVWPHDNSIVAAGLRRYGLDEGALRIFQGIARTAMHFKDYRLPEVFAGYSREQFHEPVRYPVACHPQAWAAGSTLYLIENMLGLIPEAFEGRLRIVRPRLPSAVDRLEVRGLRVGQARVDLHFVKSPDGVEVETMSTDGQLDILIERASDASGKGSER